MISVKWVVSSNLEPIGDAEAIETLLPEWATVSSNAAAAAAYICADYFNTQTWEACFGPGYDSRHVYLTIFDPATIAGKFELDLERVTRAKAPRLRYR